MFGWFKRRKPQMMEVEYIKIPVMTSKERAELQLALRFVTKADIILTRYNGASLDARIHTTSWFLEEKLDKIWTDLTRYLDENS
jgi:hypothetical protein